MRITTHQGSRAMRAACIAALLGAAASVQAAVAEHTTLSSWLAAAGPSPTTLSFADLVPGTLLADQVPGLQFTDGDDAIEEMFIFGDGVGVWAHDGSAISFATPRTAFALDYPGAVQMDFYLAGELVHHSSDFGSYGTGFFAGVTGVSFDQVRLADPVDGDVFYDNVYLGAAVPEPGSAMLVLAGALLLGTWRLRTTRR